MLIKYIRTPKRFEAKINKETLQPYAIEIGGDLCGVVVATERGRIGWSLCNPKDKFDKQLALRIAINRADSNGFRNKIESKNNVPEKIWNEIDKIYDRSLSYFK